MTLCRPDQSTLLIIDLQARLMPAIDDGDAVVRRCIQLASAARELRIPVIGTEENPDGLGPNVPEVRALCDTTLRKFAFSAVSEAGFVEQLALGRDTLIVAGCEAHVCVMQTVARLLGIGRPVKWVSDAVGSRRAFDRDAATARARALGADIVTTEMVLFEWLETCRHPAFRSTLQLVR